jgi:death-on-curing protein
VIVYLTLEDLLRLTRILDAGPIRDVGLLSSAAARPQATAFGQEAYPTLNEKAAALSHSIASHDSLVDGNKRLAWLAAAVFLDLNGVDLDMDDDRALTLMVDVAAGNAEFAEIAERLVTRRRASGDS